ncbi:alpha/beta hydrolase [Streptobacillus felis]|uniref:alpha/beta hydrolase family protein n=1 Tax=Streptobacillus felis TaxID=1384509 RepID=UPI00083013C7|nr:alpha/beta hydrolase [Streptobacillus felis]
MKRIILLFTLIISAITFAEIKSDKIEIKNGYYTIPAIYTYNTDSKNSPLVIMIHGTASNKDEVNGTYIKMADSLAKNNISSIRFDFNGTGDSKVNYLHYTLTSATSDVKKVIEFSKKLTTGKLGLLGWSQGGTIALLSGDDQNINSISTWAGALNMFNENRIKEYEESKENGYFINEFSWRSPLKFSHQWYSEVKNLDIVSEIKEIKAPIYAVSGLDDDVVNPSDADFIVKTSKNTLSRVEKIENADHIFYTFDPIKSKIDILIQKTTNWFIETLK